MTNIESSKAARVNKLSGRFLKDGANILAKPISALCNLSMSQGVFSSASQVAKLKPIFKKGKKTDPSNYRSISLLPSISKIIERVIRDQTNAFLSDEDILSISQVFEVIIQQIYVCLIKFLKGLTKICLLE